MTPRPISDCLAHFRHSLLLNCDSGVTDGQLLGEFLARRDETAFAALVKRHGAMVFGVCRRLVGDVHLAEDAFQAVFIVLARRAGSVRPRAQIGNWLYGVAYRTALKARAMLARRHSREKQVVVMPHPEVLPKEIWHDVQEVLDAELALLPDKLRLPVVLCDLEGRSQREVARQLKLPPATLANRLASARRRLAERLGKRGIALSGGALAATITTHTAHAAVPSALISKAADAGSAIGAGGTAIGAASAKAIQLSEGVMRMLFITKLRKCALSFSAVLAIVCGLGAAAMTTAWADEPVAKGQSATVPKTQVTSKPSKSKLDDKEFLRRVCLDLRGDAPTEIETIYFVADADENKCSKVVEWLLEDPQAHAWRETRKNPTLKAKDNQCAACHQGAATDKLHQSWINTAKRPIHSDSWIFEIWGHHRAKEAPLLYSVNDSDALWIDGLHPSYTLWAYVAIDSTDEGFLRQACQEARGTPPTHLEIEYFKADKDPRKRDKLLDLLIKDPAVAKKLGDGWKKKMLQPNASDAATQNYYRVLQKKLIHDYPIRRGELQSQNVPERLVQLLDRLLKDKRGDDQVLEALALATLGRLPTESEKKLVLASVSKQEDKTAAWREVLKTFAGTSEAKQYAQELNRGSGKSPKQ
jgi:RNA polymerase sigma factor (sigma-70 family)